MCIRDRDIVIRCIVCAPVLGQIEVKHFTHRRPLMGEVSICAIG